MKHLIKFFFIFLTYSVLGQVTTTSFETQTHGSPYSRPAWQSDGFTPNNWDNGLNVRSETDTFFYVSGSHSLKIEYPKDQYGNSTSNGTGVQVELLLDPQDEYYMSYFFRFSDNFSWGNTSEGGKLPGLTNRDRCGPDFICDGTDGFSARFMWRTNGKGVLYLYHADMPAQYGQDFAFKNTNGDDFLFEKGKWYHISEYVKNNSDSSSKDGIVQVWINGNEVLYLDTIRFQTNGDKIDNFFMSTFHGGNSAAWAPTDTCYLWIDDLIISTSFSDVAYQACSNPDSEYFGENCTTTSLTSHSIANQSSIQNPVTDFINLNKTYNEIVLYNSIGIKQCCLSNSNTINVQNLPDGVYILILQNGNVLIKQKIVKNTTNTM